MDVRKRRSGYTLLEMMAAMAVVLIIAAFSVPSAQGLFGSFKIDGAVDSVRSAWAQARSRAIEEGRPYRFAVIPDTGYYRVAPDDDACWGSGGPGNHSGVVIEESLPSGVLFRVGDSGGAPCAGNSNQISDPPPSTAGPDAYGHPVVFNPDGTSNQDAEVVFNMQGVGVALSLRSLTGAVTVRHLSAGAH